MISGRQIREVRAMLKWIAAALRMRSNVPEGAIQRADNVDGTPGITLDQVRCIQETLERAGLRFGAARC